jgi:hypothetical protein
MMKYLKSRYAISIFCILAICIVLGVWATSAITSASAAHTVPKPVPAIRLATIKGDSYTVGNPAGWNAKKASVASITFLTLSPRNHNTTTLLVETVTSKGAVSSKGAVQGGLTGAKKSAKSFRIKNVSATVVINGVRWDEGAAITSDGHTTFVLVIIAARHPRNAHKLVAIIRIAKVSDFNSVDAREFKQILLSFKFV